MAIFVNERRFYSLLLLDKSNVFETFYKTSLIWKCFQLNYHACMVIMHVWYFCFDDGCFNASIHWICHGNDLVFWTASPKVSPRAHRRKPFFIISSTSCYSYSAKRKQCWFNLLPISVNFPYNQPLKLALYQILASLFRKRRLVVIETFSPP